MFIIKIRLCQSLKYHLLFYLWLKISYNYYHFQTILLFTCIIIMMRVFSYHRKGGRKWILIYPNSRR